MSNYSDLLKHPNWQKKRLEIMSRDGFSCTVCWDKDSTLNVHHKYYQDGKKPWEYEDDALSTLCEKCHNSIHKFEDDFYLSGFFERYEIDTIKKFGTVNLIDVIGNVLCTILEGATKKELLEMLFYCPLDKTIDKEQLYKETIIDMESLGESESIECEIVKTRLKLLQLEREEARQ